ncbi:Zn-ribbon domain-containing OB-fold protein [Halarchaeum acidiphilum]|uniref:Zn-ribbon domain-containing OB-fold protein n=1 Tax=Halarchaeum acidiphilum TaxID=489138 RepID=UPI0009DBFAC7|nr:OB-fold domain-containing protein [Halarchaeum acidiphilum]
MAGRCPECGGLTFPAEGACGMCYDCVDFARVELPREGVVEAATVIGQGGAPPEFISQQDRDGPYAVAVVRFTLDGADVTLPMQVTDCDPDHVEVGDAVRATVRRVYTDEGIPRYGAKVTPTE